MYSLCLPIRHYDSKQILYSYKNITKQFEEAVAA